MANGAINRPKVTPLPATKEDMESRLKIKRLLNLNDSVHAIHRAIWGDPDYFRYLDATADDDAVEGSMAADDLEIAEIFRNYAKAHGDVYVAGKKKHTIVRALKVVWRRYGIDRQSRRGELPPSSVAEAAE